MATFGLVFFKTISVLLSVLVGFLAGKYSGVERNGIASLLFYYVSPIVFFSIPANTELTLSSASVALLTFSIATTLSISAYFFFGRYWRDYTRNVIALSAGSANAGYFMLPIASAFFDDYTLSIYMMTVIGVNVFEASVGLYICARSVTSAKESLKKVLKLPILNAFALGCFFSLLGLRLPGFLEDFAYDMRICYSILGMAMVGLGVSSMKKLEIDLKFTAATFFLKFFCYPVAINLFVLLDKLFLGWYDENYYDALRLLSTAPMAANLIVISSIHRFDPEKVAATVLLSLLFVLIYMPISASLFLSDWAS